MRKREVDYTLKNIVSGSLWPGYRSAGDIEDWLEFIALKFDRISGIPNDAPIGEGIFGLEDFHV